MKLVLLGNIVAWPVAYYVMNNWLQNFAYRINISFWIFLFASFIVFVIAFLTVASHTVKAANENPVKALRYE